MKVFEICSPPPPDIEHVALMKRKKKDFFYMILRKTRSYYTFPMIFCRSNPAVNPQILVPRPAAARNPQV